MAYGTDDMVRDPICGTPVSTHSAKGRTYHEGRTYHFCSLRCESAFDAEPERYAQHVNITGASGFLDPPAYGAP